jgi:membrane protease subunit HflK
MAWNEPGGNRNDQDPWGGNNKNQGPPDLDQALKQMMKKINDLFGSGGSGRQGGSGSGSSSGGAGGVLFVVGLIVLVFLAFKSVYTIDEQQRGVVLQMGKYDRTLDPGLHFVIPLLEVVLPVNVTNVRNIEFKQEMLTQDENVVEIDLNIQYTVADPVSFVLRIEDPDNTLRHAAESALRHEVGSTNLNPILTDGRALLATNTMIRLQEYVNRYQTGISVSIVNIKEARAPQAVQKAFDDVQKANLDKERFVNEAEAYANTIIPEARGKRQRMLEEASAYREQVVAQAEGEAVRFEKLLGEYRKAPEVTRERLYIDAISDVYSKASKVMVDVQGGNNIMYLPLDKIISSAPSRSAGSTPDTGVSELTDQVIEELRSRNVRDTTREGR